MKEAGGEWLACANVFVVYTCGSGRAASSAHCYCPLSFLLSALAASHTHTHVSSFASYSSPMQSLLLPSSLCTIPSAAESTLCLSFQKSKSLVPLCSGPLSASALLILIQSLLPSPLSLGQLPLCSVLYGVCLGHGDADDTWHVDALGPLGEQRVNVPKCIRLYRATRGEEGQGREGGKARSVMDTRQALPTGAGMSIINMNPLNSIKIQTS